MRQSWIQTGEDNFSLESLFSKIHYKRYLEIKGK